MLQSYIIKSKYLILGKSFFEKSQKLSFSGIFALFISTHTVPPGHHLRLLARCSRYLAFCLAAPEP